MTKQDKALNSIFAAANDLMNAIDKAAPILEKPKYMLYLISAKSLWETGKDIQSKEQEGSNELYS